MDAPVVRTADAVERVTLIGALLLLLIYGVGGNYEEPDPVHFSALLAAVAGIAAVATRRTWAGTFTLIAVLLTALHEHATQDDHRASDVMLATNEALGVLLGGGNPYTHYYLQTNPPGSVFAYPPGEVIFYGLVHLAGGNIFRADLACSIVVLGLIAAFAPFCGIGLTALAVAIVGWAPDALFHITDGSNDHAASFLIITGFSALVWSKVTPAPWNRGLWWLSAVGFGWALAFKEYSAPIVLFVAVYLWREDAARARGWIAAAAGTAAAFVLPFLVWNPGALIGNVGGELITHTNIWGRNVWHDWLRLTPLGDSVAPIIPIVTVLVILALTVVLWRRPARSTGAALLQGVAVVAAVFLFARWTTSTYYWFLVPTAIVAAIMTAGPDYAPND